MKHNEHTVDRVVRAVVGVGLVATAAALGVTSWGGALTAVVGLVLVVTAAVGFCPLYALLGVSTCPVRQDTRATSPDHAAR